MQLPSQACYCGSKFQAEDKFSAENQHCVGWIVTENRKSGIQKYFAGVQLIQ